MIQLAGFLIPFLGTMLGSAFVFFMRGEMSIRLQKPCWALLQALWSQPS